MNLFRFLTPISYWLLIVMWSCILVFYARRLHASKLSGEFFSTLILILSIDAFRTLFESIYFGAWYTSVVGWLPAELHQFLTLPANVFIPKSLNVVAAALVIIILIRRWIPQEEAERQRQLDYTHQLEEEIAERTRLNQQLVELNQLKDKFVSIAAHDLTEISDIS